MLMPIALFLGLLFLAAIFLPSMWVRRELKKHAKPRPDLPGTGGELALHLIERAGLHGVGVEPAPEGTDHYDPQTRTVRLSRSHYRGKSIAAVAVAAHEVGHALQHASDERLFNLRISLVKAFLPINKIAGMLLIVGPFLSLVLRVPGLSIVFFGLAIFVLVFQFIVHLATLPVEFDASFGKALPILSGGGYLHDDDLPAARSVLRAAALTYVSTALAGVFNILRLLRVLR